jgi:cell division septum initiation protein DivIVA
MIQPNELKDGASYERHNLAGRVREECSEDWMGAIRTGVVTFVDAVCESSRQVGDAVEKLTSDTLSKVEALSRKAQASAYLSQDMADKAQRANEEARQLMAETSRVAVEAAKVAVAETLEREHQRTMDRLNEAARAAIERLDQESRQVLEKLAARTDGEVAANSRSESDMTGRRGWTSGGIDDQGQALLDRLEVDYARLAHLVEDLKRQIGAVMTTAAETQISTQSPTASTDHSPEPWGRHPDGPGRAVAGAYDWSKEHVSAAAADDSYASSSFHGNEQGEPSVGLANESAAMELDALQATTPERQSLSPGHEDSYVLRDTVVVAIAAVSDLSCLLSIENAFRAEGRVRSVAVTSFGRGEATFHIELSESADLTEFVAGIEMLAQLDLDVAAAEPGQLRLRIKPRT